MAISLITAGATAFLILLAPGWALLACSGAWRVFRPLQRWIAAFGISAAFFPVLYYFLNAALPGLRLGANKLWLLLGLCLLITLISLRRHWLEQVRFEELEWAGIAILLITLASRLWLVKAYPYPAWSDSLHHTLLTLLTAQQGGLPADLSPYAPTPLNMYHLGLYALTAPVMLLAKVDAAAALLVVVQVLNGLCGAGVYLLLDRNGRRLGAVIGAAVAGLFSFQPAWYFNWGRDTQVASQAVLLVALVLTLAAVEEQPAGGDKSRWLRPGLVLAAGMGNAAVFLLHFRVAAFYLPLLLVALLWQLVPAARNKTSGRLLIRTLWVGLASLAFCLPALVPALPAYIQSRAASTTPDSAYYQFTSESIFSVGLQKWLAFTAAAALGIGLAYKQKTSWWALLWNLGLFAIGLAYLTRIRLLMVTNIGAVLMMLYLPASLAVGAALSAITSRFKALSSQGFARRAAAAVILAGIFAAQDRIQGVEAYRYFVQAADVKAMNWIRVNTPPDAVFAVNTWFWLPNSPHGTDAGYWIPYFTGRRTTASTMLFSLGSAGERQKVVEESLAAEELALSLPLTDDLCRMGIKYAYTGVVGDFSGTPINVVGLAQAPGTRLLYQEDGVSIYKLCGE